MRWGAIIFSVPAVLLLSLYGWELSLVNECISEGLKYDFQIGECVEGSQGIDSPYYARHTLFVNSMLLLSVVGSGMMTGSMIKRGMVRNQD